MASRTPLTVPAVVDDVRYELTSVRAIRGTESKTIAKWQQDGWELSSQSQGSMLRTELTFRRVKRETLGSRAWAAFRGLAPRVQLGLTALAGCVVLLVVVTVVVLGMRDGTATVGSTAAPTEAAPPPSAEPAEVAPQTPEATGSQVVPVPPVTEEVLTPATNADLAALLTVSDPGAAVVEAFAARYQGRLVEFDANIASMSKHGDYGTRYDLLMFGGDYSTSAAAGPNFQFQDVNTTSALHWEGASIPATIGAGTNVHVVARVLNYNSTQQLFFLDPVSTRAR